MGGLVIGFLGVIWLSVGGELSGSTLGLVCLIIAPLAWAWGSIWSRDQDLPEPFMAAAGRCSSARVAVVVALSRANASRRCRRFERDRRAAVPGRRRFDLRLHRVHLAAAPRAPRARDQLCLRQSALAVLIRCADWRANASPHA
jgi:hypothetical protein